MSNTTTHAMVIAMIALGCAPTREQAAAETSAVEETSGAEVASTDPCRGSALELDRVAAECRVETTRNGVDRAADANVLVASVEPVSVRSGERARVPVTFRNATAEPLEVVLPPSVGIGGTDIERDGELVDFRNEYSGPAFAMGCAIPCRWVRVVLEPGGALHAVVDVSARVRIRRGTTEPEMHDGEAIPPGRYDLVIWTPWLGPDADGRIVQRRVRTTVEVTP
ncbi:hypothetical protein [Sandaracinus amylolyticus]|uniref:hypothetical protein n=1 Tax=Sandaracinus amylolyticus TaxID=927083 RepID=UPI001F37B176|nr:hypothetical protein [Sandaracinus amylolyticus]